jgi:putative radical SAM enzyme (TIGR03279 family)
MTGARLVRINGKPVRDILDYRFYSYDRKLELAVAGSHGVIRYYHITHNEGGDLGLEFDLPLMDEQKHCHNKCIFCFIDQQPPNMRKTLYYKDDDMRMSFLQGTYITLTNLYDEDIDRIIEQRISPLRISVHATDPAVRYDMLNHRNAGLCLDTLKRLTNAGIEIHAQIVVCPGVNDGEVLTQTLKDLTALGALSVAVVPVGLTKYRDGLYPLTPVSPEIARDCIERAEKFKHVYCADELFLKAGFDIPPSEYYDDYPQLENGVGLLSLFADDFLHEAEGRTPKADRVSIATGTSFASHLKRLVPENVTIYDIINSFWGDTVTVAGLITGKDLIDQLSGKDLGERLLIPANMLRCGCDVFLDDLTVDDVKHALNIEVIVVPPYGEALVKELYI